MKEISNKQRLIKLIEIFEQKTDQNYQLSVEDIIVELRNEYGNHYDVAPSTINLDFESKFQ
jgi:translation initiation factor 2 alpha subunit (eIF-2alpha)